MNGKIIKLYVFITLYLLSFKEEHVLNLNIYRTIILYSFLSFILIFNPDLFAQYKTGKFAIVIHGGAGYISNNIPEELKQLYNNSLTDALNIGKEILANGGTSLDAVEKVINYFESNILFNSGKGAVFTSEGKH